MSSIVTFHKSIAMLLIAWITIVGHVAVAMPFCQRAEHQEASVAQQTDNDTLADASDHGAQDCPQHKNQDGSKGSLACDACGMCHMACHAVPSVASVVVDLPNRIYGSTLLPVFLSFVPEEPQHVPLAPSA